MSETVRSGGHLLVAGISLADVEAAMSFARLILERFPMTPAGLLVETRTASLATGAGHRIVSVGGTLREIPSDEQSRLIAKSEARTLRSLISQLATEHSTHSSCNVAEGDLVACACAATDETDMLLLCQRPILGFHGNVLLLGEERSHSAEALAVARALAQTSATTVLEVRAGDEADEEMIFDRVDRSRATAIVVDLNVGPLTSEEDLRRLVSAARCPVIVIGASRTRRQASSAHEGGEGSGG